jgi:hypothetical protein
MSLTNGPTIGGDIGNRHSRLAGLLHEAHLLFRGISAPAMNSDKHFDSISIRSHSHNASRKPNPYSGDGVRVNVAVERM